MVCLEVFALYPFETEHGKFGAEPEIWIAFTARVRVSFGTFIAFELAILKLSPFRMCNNEISETQRTQQFN